MVRIPPSMRGHSLITDHGTVKSSYSARSRQVGLKLQFDIQDILFNLIFYKTSHIWYPLYYFDDNKRIRYKKYK